MTRSGTVVKLCEVAEVNPRHKDSLPSDALVSFVPMAGVDAESARVESVEARPYGDVRRGYTPFRRGDVLVAKITPCFENGKIAQAEIPYEIGFGSTEFHVIRPSAEALDSRYLLHLLRQDSVRRAGERRMTGSAGQRRVPAAFLSELEFSLPPVSEQRRISEVLDRAEELRQKRRAAISRVDQLQRSVFLAYASQSGSAHAEGTTCCLGELMAQRAGSVNPAKFPDEVFDLYSIPAYDRGVPETLAGSQIGSTKQIVQPGDVLLSKIVPHIRRAWVVGEAQGRRLIGSGEWIVFRTSECEPAYLRELLLSDRFHAEFMRTVSGVGGSLLRARPAEVARIQVSVPPLSTQRAFVAAVTDINGLRQRSHVAAAKLNSLFTSLQHRAFKGEL